MNFIRNRRTELEEQLFVEKQLISCNTRFGCGQDFSFSLHA
jgi:hypothetical protein